MYRCTPAFFMCSLKNHMSKSYCPGDGRAWEVDGRAQALVSPGVAVFV